MNNLMSPFNPGPTVSLAVTTTTGNVALPTVAKQQVMVSTLPGDAVCFIKFGVNSGVAAAVTDTPILPGGVYILTIDPAVTHIAAITGTGTATLYVTTGRGD